MSSLLKSTNNTRAILPDSYRFLRSDVPSRITEEEVQWLLEHDIRTIIDLRAASELERRPCPLQERKEFRYLNLPVTGGNAVPACPDQVAPAYIAMADEGMEHIVRTCLEAEGGVLYFCAAGKDRTGVLSALLLHRFGFDRAYIREDYLKSLENLKEELASYASQHPEIDPDVITPQAKYIDGFLDWLEE